MKNERYYLVNFLNLFFSSIGTVEFRCHEGSLNSTKILNWMVISASIIKYAENIKRGLSATKLTLKEILDAQLPEKYSAYIMSYMNTRSKVFTNPEGGYRSSWKTIEKKWFEFDAEYNFKLNNFEIK